ncbi:hypothetical protein DS745_03560 [Anaerobacillus alkaliphilus]|uniref:Uncharacterized protein n=1 Tax=Anaerobacillus alkaliphilus TaxID=1548597 RepID=A0A4Q0VYK0_9BACI|nr:hypothetical protein [Anaerobacillus alkaliphilus]RXJ04472.1 hypothetical protein DS745_03560 [Anaerobacillus alkaliphilus]
MFTVRTYVSKNEEWYSEGVSVEVIQRDFLRFEDRRNKEEIGKLIKSKRLYGFVKIHFGDEEILGAKEYGTITDMWSVFIQLIRTYVSDGKASEEFPDYMLEISLSDYDKDHVILELPAINKRHILPKKEFITAWTQGSFSFYEALVTYDHENIYFPDEETKMFCLRNVRSLLEE